MIIPQPYPRALPAGLFAIPALQWQIGPIGLNLNAMAPFRGMFTIVQQRFGFVTAGYLPLVTAARFLTPADINILEAGLLNDINVAIASWRTPLPPTDADLTRIAIGIQLWGGITGRPPFINNGGFLNNFNVAAYRAIIGSLLAPPPIIPAGIPYPALQNAVNLWQGPNFQFFGVSFAAKHFSFWARAAGMPTPLPIYDRIMARYFMGLKYARWRDYWIYVNGMRNAVAAINAANPNFVGAYTVTQLERELFVWANSPAPVANGWPR